MPEPGPVPPSLDERFSRQRGYYLLAFIAIFAFILRLTVALHFGPALWHKSSDAVAFDIVAVNLLNGRGYMDNVNDKAARFPVLPTVMAGVYAVFGDWNQPDGDGRRMCQVLFCAIGAGGCLLAYWAGMLLTQRRTVALLSALGCAIYPMFVFISAIPLTENLSIVLTLALICFLLKLDADPSKWRYAFLAGVVLGLELLNRSTVSLFAPAIFFWLWWRWGRARTLTAITRTAVIALIALAILTPWAVRNARVLDGAFVMFTTAGGWAFYNGNNPAVLKYASGNARMERNLPNPKMWTDGQGMLDDMIDVDPTPYAGFQTFNAESWNATHGHSEVERNEYFYKAGWQFIRDHPGTAAWFAVVKAGVFWLPYKNKYHVISLSIVVFLALVGLALGRLDNGRWMIVYLLILTRVLAGMIYFTNPRYKVPITPFLVIMAAVGLMSCVQHGRNIVRLWKQRKLNREERPGMLGFAAVDRLRPRPPLSSP